MSVVTGAGCVGCSSAKVTREFSCIVGCNEITDGVSVTDCDVTPAALDRVMANVRLADLGLQTSALEAAGQDSALLSAGTDNRDISAACA